MKKKYKRAGTTSERQDYRKGGLVGDGKRVKKYLILEYFPHLSTVVSWREKNLKRNGLNLN